MAEKKKTRNIEIDTLRGLACILLVSYHVIGITPDSGLRLQGGILKEINEMLAYIRMPLFTFLSGIVYGWRPYTSDWTGFMKGKIRRLIIPMLFIGTIFAIFQTITPGTNHSVENWFTLHLKPVAHFWFLESLFLIFLMIIPLEHAGILQRKTGFGVVFLIASICYTANIGTPWLSIAGFFYLFPYFLAGLYAERFPLNKLSLQQISSIMLAVLLVLLFMYGHEYGGPRRSPNALTIGLLFCMLLYLTRMKSTILASIGFYSYSIYLFHVFFTAGARIVLSRFGVTELWTLFTFALAAGLAGPVIVELVAARYNPAQILMLGKRPIAAKQ